MEKNRATAWELLTTYTSSESLLKHGLAVEAALRWYARKWNEDEELWGMTGLLHDFDYERYPNPDEGGHPYVGSKILTEQGFPEVMIEAILGHAHYTGVKRETKLAKTLFACDELSGLVTAAVLVRPDRALANLSVSSVKKKMKDKAFARGVNRDDIVLGATELGIELDEHIGNVIEALSTVASELGLAGDGNRIAGNAS